ncbi:EAL domain-containing protein [Kineococcus rubinsiae]|uniref:EAL domain-containing protein n=1 Tax=Kineococcus rubinsiae TaxID=2609562 RepID=UPI00143040CC|nr:EAL domain-containing protein [Kineococcus rubinsiae]NIZ89414.1 EAL domain-containing protein [Kineococcus rubinsiae]
MTVVSPHRAAHRAGAAATAAAGTGELARVLGSGGLRTVFQPVVDLATRAPVAFEALVRGPVGSHLQTPHQLFGAAAAEGLLPALDDACRRSALGHAGAAGLGAPWALFLNHQPEAELGEPSPSPTAAGPRVLVDLPAHALAAHPAAVLLLVERLRRRGWGVALDDVGADLAVLPLLPLVRPDVVKLDLRLLRTQPEWSVATVVAAVGAQAERDGTLVLAEGVETEDDRLEALALGASLGQGWLFGRPGDLARQLAAATAPHAPVPVVPRAPLLGPGTAFDVVAGRSRVRTADRAQLAAARHHVELHALQSAQPHLVVPAAPAGDPRDDVAVLGPGTATALVTRRLDDEHVELVVTHDRDLVAAVVARLLVGRDADPAPAEPGTAPADAPDGGAADLDAVGLDADETTPDDTTPDDTALTSGSELTALVQQALDADRRRGSGCALLLLGTDVTRPRTGAADPGAPGEDAAGGEDPSAAVVRRLRSSVRSADRWIPLGEHLHAVLLTGLPLPVAEGVVDRVADALLHALESSALTAPERSGVRVSIGASLAPFRATTSADAIAQAVSALAAARSAGGHCARIWPV